MRFKTREPKVRTHQTDLFEWHKWWAWHPVRVEGYTIVWETIYRKGSRGYGGITWEYKIEGVM